MNYYEMMIIFSPNLTDEDEKAQSLQVEELLKKEGGTIHLIDHWGKRKLAYPVKKQRQGYYEWYYFELDPGRAAEIDRKLKMSEVILRFMILKMEKIQIESLHREAARRLQAAAAPAVTEPVQQEPVAAEPVQPAPAAEAPEASVEGTGTVEVEAAEAPKEN